MTDTTTTATGTAARPSWLTHPIQAWRMLLAAQTDRTDSQARAAGLTVEDLSHGVRRYRDAHLDEALAAYRACNSADRADVATLVSSEWSPVRLVPARGWSR